MSDPTNAVAIRQAQTDLLLAQNDQAVPEFVGIDLAQWQAMDTEARVYAIEFFRKEMEETTRGVEVRFPRIKYPASGSKRWIRMGPDGKEEELARLEMVVVFKHAARAYWPGTDAVTGTPPTCRSNDGIRPVPSPTQQATLCETCRHSQWGSGKNGEGQACKAALNIFGLFPGDEIPTFVKLPPTGIRTFSDYAMLIRKSPKEFKGGLIGMTSKFELTEAQNKAGIRYTGLRMAAGSPITYDEMVASRALAKEFEKHMRGLAEEDLGVPEPGADDVGGPGPGVTVIEGQAKRDDDDIPF